jgi:transaldolase
MYVEELIGSETVTTVPAATLSAFRDHGHVRGATVTEGIEAAGAALSTLGELGIDLRTVANKLQLDGVAAFASDYSSALAAIERMKQVIVARRLGQRNASAP